ncbi:flavin-containing monooxygenase [Mycobacterium sp. 2YAF39]|uniref:flavin-containing monooxygenase n=1 Tax=Mycobacterium sp. 2YAF39 TaxID=3233033 RepID=UPI003F9911D1
MNQKPTVAVIGAGPGGIATGIQLRAGGYDFTIFERGEGFGGTWRNNTYPGAACDVPSHLYSFSFAPNPRWSKTFANQPEILAYLERVALDHGLADHLRAHTRVSALRWSDSDRRWAVTTSDGVTTEFDVVVSAVGMLDKPFTPDIPGAERFTGRIFHSSEWDHSKSTAGERVASIGTGASAIQFVPEIAPAAAQLTVFQRSPTWVGPRYDEPFTSEQQELFEREPAEAQKVRDAAFMAYESGDFAVDSQMTRELTKFVSKFVVDSVKDPDLRARLTPSHPVGCKRPLFSQNWFPTFDLPNVTLETSPIVEFTERGLRTADGVEHEADTVIYGTGFRAADYLGSLDVYGRGGRRLHDDWSAGAEAYLGTVVPGYPNLFTLYGPNTNGVQSIIYILEVQTEFVRRLLDAMVLRGVQAVDVDRKVHEAYNDEIQDALAGTVWLAGCNNYFQHPSGKVVTQFPYHGRELAVRLAEVDLEHFDCHPYNGHRQQEAGSCEESTIRQ